MAQLMPELVLVIVLLFTPQLVALPWPKLYRGTNKPLTKSREKSFDIDQNLLGGSPPNPPPVDGGNSNGDIKCSISTNGLQAPLRWSIDMMGYVVELGISGTANAHNFLVATANNFVWTDQCLSFPATAVVPQECNSEQCGLLLIQNPCGGDRQCQYVTPQMRGYLTNSSFTLTNSKPFNLSFGCNQRDDMVYKRIAGMGRGPLSLTSQIQVSKFSYCFTDYGDASISGQMFFGSYAVFDEGTKNVATTRFQLTANKYSIKLTGITVGQFSVQSFAATQVIIDSSRPLTYLDTPVYTKFWNAINSIIRLWLQGCPTPYAMCFFLQTNVEQKMPEITFNFEDAKMILPMRNYLFHCADNNYGSFFCFAIMPNVDANGYGAGYSILGNFQQQNIQFIYDLQNMTLSFGSVDCSMLQSRKDDTSVSCERTSSPATSNGARVELGGRVAATLPFLFFFYYLFVPLLII